MAISDKAKKSLNKVVKKMKDGNLSEIVDIARIELDDDAPAKNWSFNNRVLAYLQTGGDLDVRGYRQWKEAGRHVKKGETSAYILVPKVITVEEENEDGEATEEKRCIGFFGAPVFGYSQTAPLDDDDESVISYEPRELPPLSDIAERLGVDIDFSPLGAALGTTTTDGSEITLGTDDPAVMFHELAHAVHSELEGGLKGGQHTDQETIAELTSCVLMDLYGFGDRSGNSWQYIETYADDPLTAITRALDDIEKILDVILT